ncbi:MAG: hypothetical protein WEA09_01445 [Gemmatimonadota bacterium]
MTVDEPLDFPNPTPATPAPASIKLEEGALRLLGRREHSRQELRRKLRKREWPANQVEEEALDWREVAMRWYRKKYRGVALAHCCRIPFVGLTWASDCIAGSGWFNHLPRRDESHVP